MKWRKIENTFKCQIKYVFGPFLKTAFQEDDMILAVLGGVF